MFWDILMLNKCLVAAMGFEFYCPYKFVSSLSWKTIGALVSVGYLYLFVRDIAQAEYLRKRQVDELIKVFGEIILVPRHAEIECESKAKEDNKSGEDGHQEGAIQAEIEDRTAREKRLADYEKLKEYQKGDPWKEEPLEDKRHKDADPKTDGDEEPKFSCKGEENCGWCKEQGLKGCLNPKAAEDGQSVVGASSCE